MKELSKNAEFWVWVTKHALTKGIIKVKVVSLEEPKWVRAVENSRNLEYRRGECFLRPEWHVLSDDAIRRAVTMRELRVASLVKQLAKVRKIQFEIPQEDP